MAIAVSLSHLMRARPAGEIQHAARAHEHLVDRAALRHGDAAFQDRHVRRRAARGDQQARAAFRVLRFIMLVVADRAFHRHVVRQTARHHGQDLAFVPGVGRCPGVAVDDVVAGLQGRGGADVLHDTAAADRQEARPVEAAAAAADIPPVEDGAVFQHAVFLVVHALHHAEVIFVVGRAQIGPRAVVGIGRVARMVVLQHDRAEAVDGDRAAANVGEVLMGRPVGGNDQALAGGDRVDLARIDRVPEVIHIAGDTALGIVNRLAVAAAAAADELNDRRVGAAEPQHIADPQVQVFHQVVVALLVFPAVPAGVDFARSGHDDPAAFDLYIIYMGAARHAQRRAHGADRLGDVAVRILVGLPAADVVRDRHIHIRRDAEEGESADVHDPSAGHAHGAADVPAVVGRVVAEVRIDGAGIVHGSHVLAVASVRCGVEDGR